MGQAFLYGTGGAGAGGTLTITAPAGVTCTISKDGKTKTKTVDQYGYATFKGLDTGIWTVTISDGSQTSSVYTVEIVADYAVTVSFFSATIAVTFPVGATCTCSDGNTTLTAPTTSGSYTFNVSNTGTWTVKATVGTKTYSEDVVIDADGQSKIADLTKKYIFRNGEFTDGGFDSSFTSLYDDNQLQYCYAKINDYGNLEFKTHANGKTGIVYTTQKYSIDNFSKIVFVIISTYFSSTADGAGVVSGTISLGVSDNQTGTDFVANKSFKGTGNSTTATNYEVDLSGSSGEYYIKITDVRGSTTYYNDFIAFSKIYLEV